MSEKELLYIDDTLSHLKQIDEFCNDYIVSIEDDTLKNVVDNLITKNNEVYKKVYKLLEE